MCLGIPGRVIRIDEGGPMIRTGVVDFGGVCKEINLSYVPEARIDDYVIVHVGFAISKVDQASADATFRYLEEMLSR